jgi:hypothetical protein
VSTAKGGQEIRWDEDAPTEAPELSEEDKFAYQQRIEAMDKVLTQKQKAKYKIELFFGKARSNKNPVPGVISFWESGSQLHGGGDAKVYFCPGKMLRKNRCEALIPFALNAYGHLVCPSCKSVWKGEEVIGEILGRHTMRDWSSLLYTYFRRLDHNCDIYLKHAPEDIRSMAAMEQERQRGGDLLSKARKRALYIYPLRNILRDTSAGADILGRFYSFLTS